MSKPTRSAYAGVFLLAGSIILFQIALTRVFAIMMWHHFTYMVVSIALLGFGAAGSILTARRERSHGGDTGSLAFLGSAYGISVIVAFCFATLVRIDSLAIWERKSNILALLQIYLIIAVPMLLGGLVIGRALTHWARHVNRLYFADLLGSAVGGGVSVPILSTTGSTPAVMIAGALGCLAGFLFSIGDGSMSRRIATGVVFLGSLIVVGGFLGMPGVPAMDWTVPYAPGKDIEAFPAATMDRRIPSATAEVEVTKSLPGSPPMIGGNFSAVGTSPVEARYVAQDGTAPTMLYRDAASIERFPFLRRTQAGSAYVAREATGRTAPEVLVIGVGGGVDVMVALAHEAKHVTAVEINTAMIRMVREYYADYMGRLFSEDPGNPMTDRVELVNREGRSYMRHQDKRYDLIQMNGVDSFTALSTGAYTLSESYLYTTDAIVEFYEHLEDGGFVNYSRFILNYPRKPRETLRLANIARTALERLGVEDPASHIAVFQGIDWASTMIKRGPFTEVEIRALREFAVAEGFRGLVFDPLRKPEAGFDPEAQSINVARRYFVEAVEKERSGGGEGPEDVSKFSRDMAEAYVALFRDDEATANAELTEALAGFPEASRPRYEPVLRGLLTGAVEYGREDARHFVMTQRDFDVVLRGSPAERAAFAEAYEYDITPCTDDSPFFFNYYKYASLFSGASEQGSAGANVDRYHPDFPVGHMVLLASLAQIAILAFLFIIMPIRSLARQGVAMPGRWRYFTYFAALGVGFMFIEIVLMQKMVIFLGHPTYALSIVLTSLLGFAGVGSLLAGRIQRISGVVLLLLALGVLGALAFEIWAVNHLLTDLLGSPFWMRVGMVVGLLMPLGLMLGMPFPSGIRVLEANCPDLLPWGWAINGFLSVLASILCIILGQERGFTEVLYVAGAVYVVGFACMLPERKRAPEATPSVGVDAAEST